MTHVFFQDVEQASLYIICPKQGQRLIYTQTLVEYRSPRPAPGALDREPFYICEYTSAMAREEARSFCQKLVTTIRALKSRS